MKHWLFRLIKGCGRATVPPPSGGINGRFSHFGTCFQRRNTFLCPGKSP